MLDLLAQNNIDQLDDNMPHHMKSQGMNVSVSSINTGSDPVEAKQVEKKLQKLSVSGLESVRGALETSKKELARLVEGQIMNYSNGHILYIFERSGENSTGNVEGQKVSRLVIADLACSEKHRKSVYFGNKLMETAEKASELVNFSKCISYVLEGKRDHILFAEDPLLYLLQESLGGTSKTCHIISISLSENDKEQTFSSLAYSEKVGSIFTTPNLPGDSASAASQRRSVSQKSVFKASKVIDRTPNVRNIPVEPQTEETFFNLQLQRGITGDAAESSLNYPSKILDRFSAVAREDLESVSQPNTYRQRMESGEPSLILFPPEKVYPKYHRPISVEVRFPHEASCEVAEQSLQMPLGVAVDQVRVNQTSARSRKDDTVEEEPLPRESTGLVPERSPAKKLDTINPYARPRAQVDLQTTAEVRRDLLESKPALTTSHMRQHREQPLDSTAYNSRKRKQDSAHTGLKYSSNNPHSWIEKCTSVIADTDTELKVLRERNNLLENQVLELTKLVQVGPSDQLCSMLDGDSPYRNSSFFSADNEHGLQIVLKDIAVREDPRPQAVWKGGASAAVSGRIGETDAPRVRKFEETISEEIKKEDAQAVGGAQGRVKANEKVGVERGVQTEGAVVDAKEVDRLKQLGDERMARKEQQLKEVQEKTQKIIRDQVTQNFISDCTSCGCGAVLQTAGCCPCA